MDTRGDGFRTASGVADQPTQRLRPPDRARRRVAFVALAAVGVLVAAACTSEGAVRSGDASPVTGTTEPAGSAPATSASDVDPTTATSADATPDSGGEDAIDVAPLSEAGITIVADDSDGSDVPERGFTLSRAQAERLLARTADGAGWMGEDLDALARLPDGAPGMSYLIAAWASSGATEAARRAAAWMPDAEWEQAPTVNFPLAAVALYVADVARAFSGPTSASAISAQGGLLHGGRGAAAAPPRAGSTDGGCTAVNSFLAATLLGLFEALRVGDAESAAAAPAPIAADWAAALALAGPEIEARAPGLTPTVVDAIRTSAASLGVAVEIVSYFQNHWLSLRLEPSSMAYPFAIGEEADVTASVIAGTDASTRDWSPALQMCASSAGVALPTLLEPGAEARWSVRFGADLIRLDADTSTLDQDLTARVQFRTGREPEEHRDGTKTFSSAAIHVTVPREDVADFLLLAGEQVRAAKDELLGRLADDELQDAVSDAYERAIDPVLDQLEAAVERNATSLFSLQGDTTMIVEYHLPPTTTTSPPTSTEPPSTPPPSEPDERDLFCAKLAGVDTRLDPGDLVGVGLLGMEVMTELAEVAPPEMEDEVATAYDTYSVAATGNFMGVVQRAEAFALAIIAMFEYCGMPIPEG